MSGRILVVDDDADALEQMRALLEARGFTVQTARDGDEALTALLADADREPCLVILDLNMPGMDGEQLFARMRSSARFSVVPVVLVTASEPSPELIPAVHAFLRKPVDAAYLLEVVQRICRCEHRAHG